MKPIMDFLFILLLGSVVAIIRAQAPPFSRGFYSSVVTPTSRYSYHHGGGFVPLTYKSDLIPEESKHRISSKYSKKPSYKGYSSDEDDISSERFTSEEYSNEAKHPFASKEQDSREYTIGTQIRVQHPISAPKKSSSSSYPTKSTKYSTLPNIGSSYSLDVSHEEHGSDSYSPTSSKQQKYTKHYEPDPFHVIAPPKSKTPSYHSSSSSSIYSSAPSSSYNVYEPQSESYEHPEVAVKHLKSNLRDRYKEVASKKQIEKYIEDQEKLLDEALKLQLLNSPKFQKLLKTAEKEHQFKEPEYDEEYIANIPPPFRDSFPKSGPPKSKRGRRRPPSSEFKRAIKSKPSGLSKPNRKYRQAYVIEV